MEENWKPIPGYEGRYMVSDQGRVKSMERKVPIRNHYTGNWHERTVKERILRPGTYCKAGHLSVVLGHGECGKPVHQLVMQAFVGDAPEGMEVRHLNGNPKDNRLENLCYGTRTENILDVFWQGKKWRKLTLDDVIRIRFSCFCGISDDLLAKEFNVSKYTIAEIRKGNTYTWIE